MSNVFLTPLLVAQRALATLYNNAVIAALVYRDYDSDFAGKQGDTVNVRVPVIFAADEFDRSVGIVIQNATEDRFPIVLDQIADVSFSVTSEELLLDIDDFAGRLLVPAMEAINQKIDGDLADALIGAANQVPNPSGDYAAMQTGGGVAISADPVEPLKCLVGARVKMGRAKLPTLNRAAVISPEGAGEALKGDLIVQANQRGDTDGLVEATIGRKFGFDTFESQVFGDNPALAGRHIADGVAFHSDAVALATRALQIPLGKLDANGVSVGAAIAQYKGMGLRVIYDYDVNHKQDVVSIDFLYGLRAVRPQGAVELDLGVNLGEPS
jgi:hypothetical protein